MLAHPPARAQIEPSPAALCGTNGSRWPGRRARNPGNKYGTRPIKSVLGNSLRLLIRRTVAAAHLKQKLGIGFGETTADGAFTLKEAECLGACGDAPVLLVNNKRMACAMTADKLDQLIEECK